MDEITPDAAQAEAKQIMADRASPYWDHHHPLHKDVVGKVAHLMTAAHGARVAYDDDGNSSGFVDEMASVSEAPADPGEYSFDHIPLPKGEAIDEGFQAAARGWFHEAGVSVPEQKSLSLRVDKVSRLSAGDKQKLASDSAASLRKTWGQSFDGNVAKIEALVDHLGPDFRRTIMASGVNNDAFTLAALLRIAKTKGF
jgi:hypothetical protein